MIGNDFNTQNSPGSAQASQSGTMDPAEVRRIRNVLKEITEFAEHSSLTGAMKHGGRQAARQYNALVQHLQATSALPPYLLVQLEEDAALDEVGVAARILSGYLKADEPSTAPRLADLPDLHEMKEIGKRVRAQLEMLPDWLKGRIAQGEQEGRSAKETASSEIKTRLEQIRAELDSVSRELRDDLITSDRRAELAERLSSLSREQAQLEVQRDTLGNTP